MLAEGPGGGGRLAQVGGWEKSKPVTDSKEALKEMKLVQNVVLEGDDCALVSRIDRLHISIKLEFWRDFKPCFKWCVPESLLLSGSSAGSRGWIWQADMKNADSAAFLSSF